MRKYLYCSLNLFFCFIDMWNYARWINSYKFRQYDYNLIDDVYNNIRKDSRVIFILRHAERWSDCWEEWGLNKNWFRQAKALWKRLNGWNLKNTESDLYLATPYKRTPETSFFVWCGRGYSLFLKDKKIFQKDRRKYDKISTTVDVVNPYYLSYEISFEELNKKSIRMANKLCQLTEWHNFCFITSHDHLLVPLITRISEWLIKFTLKTWINYLSWIAIIVDNTTKQWECYPIRTFRDKSMMLDDSWDFKWVLCSNSKILK